MSMMHRCYLILAAVLGVIVGWIIAHGGPQSDNLHAALARCDFLAAQHFHSRDRAIGWRESAEEYLIGARIARRAEALDDAEQLLDEAVRRGAGAKDIAFERLLLRAQRGHATKVRPELADYLRGRGDTAALAWEALGRGYLHAFRLHEAMECFDQLLIIRPQSLLGYLGRGETRRQFPGSWYNPIADSERDFLPATRIAPWHFQARLRLGEAKACRPESARFYLHRLMAAYPGSPEAATMFARMLNHEQQFDAARPILDSVIRDHPSFVPALVELGLNYLCKDQFDEAQVWFQRAVDLDPDNLIVLYNMQRLLAADDTKADAYRERYLKIQTARWNLENLIREMTDDWSGRDKNDPSLRYRAGLAALKLGRRDEARLWFERALIEDPRYEPASKALLEHFGVAGKP